jgi:DNA polymerase-1
VGHECKSVLRWLLRGSGALPRVEFDTLVAAYLIDPALGQSTLGELASRFVDEDLPSLNAASDELDFGGASEARALAWAEHASFVMHLTAAMREAIESIDATKLLNEIELPLISVLARMEHVGVGVNRDRLQEINSHLEGAVAQLLTTIHQVAGKEFNVNSPAQLRQILFEERKLTPGKKTKTGFSTDAATLERLRDPATVAFTRRSTKQWLVRGVSAVMRRICTTFPCGRTKARYSGRCSCLLRDGDSWWRITTRSSCDVSLILPLIPDSSMRSTRAKTFIGLLPLESLGSRSRR